MLVIYSQGVILKSAISAISAYSAIDRYQARKGRAERGY